MYVWKNVFKTLYLSFHFFFVHLFFIFNTKLFFETWKLDLFWLSFIELLFIHSFTSFQMEEFLFSDHLGELFTDTFENLLDSCGVTKEWTAILRLFVGLYQTADLMFWGSIKRNKIIPCSGRPTSARQSFLWICYLWKAIIKIFYQIKIK